MNTIPGDAPAPHAEENAELEFNPEAAAEGPGASALTRFEAKYLGQDGIEGVGEGQTDLGDPAITVYIRDSGVARKLPKQFEGWPVQSEIVGAIDAY
jgi:hypothetical protein